MKKIILPGLLAGFVNLLAAMLVSKIFVFLCPTINTAYQNPNLFRSYSDPLMILFFVYPFLLGIILAWFWNETKSLYPSDVEGGLRFGLNYWIIATIPGMFVTYSSMPYSLPIVVSWLVEGLISALIAGTIFAKLNKN